MFFVPYGTVVKDADSFQSFATRKNVCVEAREYLLNGEIEFSVDVKYDGYSYIGSRSYTVEVDKVEDGYKVKRVWNVT